MPIDQITISAVQEKDIRQQDLTDVYIPNANQKQLAKLDLLEGIKQWHVWLMLAYQDIKIRYRRSTLGPFWITLSMAITVYSMGYLYSHLFHSDILHYFPYLASGMLGWSLLLTLVLDYTDGFAMYQGLIRQIKLPYSLHIHRIVARNLLIFFHNFLVMVPIYIFFHASAPITWNMLLLFPALLIIYLNAITYGIIIASISARYRDISQIIKSLMQVIFFLTPVMWEPAGKQKLQLIANLNPFYAFLELIRQPLLGNLPTKTNLFVVSIASIIGLLVSYKMLVRYRSRIIYWL